MRQRLPIAAVGKTRVSRFSCALLAMVVAWLCSLLYLVLLQMTFEPGAKIWILAEYAGFIAAVSFVIFVIPMIMIPPLWFQLRYPAVLVLASTAYDILFLRLSFRGWPWHMIEDGEAGLFFVAWVFGFMFVAVWFYLVLLYAGQVFRRPKHGGRDGD